MFCAVLSGPFHLRETKYAKNLYGLESKISQSAHLRSELYALEMARADFFETRIAYGPEPRLPQ